MRAWLRASRQRLCGACGGHIRQGEPLLVLTIEKGGYSAPQKVRGVCCAGEPVPEVLPDVPTFPAIQPSRSALSMTRLADIELPFDYKLAAAGDREPGEDDQEV